MFGGDFHITLKMLVFLPKANSAAKSGGLKAGGCPKDREMNSISAAWGMCVLACVRACVFGSLLIPYNRDHSAEEKPRALLDFQPETEARCDTQRGGFLEENLG